MLLLLTTDSCQFDSKFFAKSSYTFLEGVLFFYSFPGKNPSTLNDAVNFMQSQNIVGLVFELSAAMLHDQNREGKNTEKFQIKIHNNECMFDWFENDGEQ